MKRIKKIYNDRPSKRLTLKCAGMRQRKSKSSSSWRGSGVGSSFLQMEYGANKDDSTPWENHSMPYLEKVSTGETKKWSSSEHLP